jgi:hypothetical protein
MDNFFSSPTLFRELRAEDIFATGTCRTNRRGWPDGLHPKLLKNLGDTKSLQCGSVIATTWKDKKQVNFLSTAADPNTFTEVRRRQKDGTVKIILAPEVVGLYGKYMGGVDRGDQLRTQYPTARKSNKWWTYLFFFGLDSAIANAFILMKASAAHKLVTKSGKERERTQLEFRQALATQLLQLGQRAASSDRRRVTAPNTPHWPTVGKGKRCRRCLALGIRRETQVVCDTCHVNLCVACFKPWHPTRRQPTEE